MALDQFVAYMLASPFRPKRTSAVCLVKQPKHVGNKLVERLIYLSWSINEVPGFCPLAWDLRGFWPISRSYSLFCPFWVCCVFFMFDFCAGIDHLCMFICMGWAQCWLFVKSEATIFVRMGSVSSQTRLFSGEGGLILELWKMSQRPCALRTWWVAMTQHKHSKDNTNKNQRMSKISFKDRKDNSSNIIWLFDSMFWWCCFNVVCLGFVLILIACSELGCIPKTSEMVDFRLSLCRLVCRIALMVMVVVFCCFCRCSFSVAYIVLLLFVYLRHLLLLLDLTCHWLLELMLLYSSASLMRLLFPKHHPYNGLGAYFGVVVLPMVVHVVVVVVVVKGCCSECYCSEMLLFGVVASYVDSCLSSLCSCWWLLLFVNCLFVAARWQFRLLTWHVCCCGLWLFVPVSIFEFVVVNGHCCWLLSFVPGCVVVVVS